MPTPLASPTPALPLSAAPTQGQSATPIAFVNAIVAAYAQRGMDASAALAKAQIEPNLLAQPQARITAMQMEWVSALAMQELDDEGLGWFSRRLPWGSYGMLVRASLQLTEVRSLGALQEFCVVSVLRNALGVACWLTDSRIPLQGTELRFAAPAHQASYQVLFDGPTRFNAPTHRLLFDARYLALPVRRDEAALQHMLQRALLLTVRPYRRDRLLVEKVRQTLAQHPEHCRNADDLAHWLHMSARTLHRQLKDEGASLQQLKDAVRRDVAVAQLQRSHRPVKQIAALAGFNNEKSFIRAFKGWTGQTPDAFRVAAQTPAFDTPGGEAVLAAPGNGPSA